jgi:hypothetical protein
VTLTIFFACCLDAALPLARMIAEPADFIEIYAYFENLVVQASQPEYSAGPVDAR